MTAIPFFLPANPKWRAKLLNIFSTRRQGSCPPAAPWDAAGPAKISVSKNLLLFPSAIPSLLHASFIYIFFLRRPFLLPPFLPSSSFFLLPLFLPFGSSFFLPSSAFFYTSYLLFSSAPPSFSRLLPLSSVVLSSLFLLRVFLLLFPSLLWIISSVSCISFSVCSISSFFSHYSPFSPPTSLLHISSISRYRLYQSSSFPIPTLPSFSCSPSFSSLLSLS